MREIDGNIMADKLIEGEDGKIIGEEILSFVNSFSFDKKGFLEGVLSNEETKNYFTEVSMLWVLKLSWFKEKNWFDGRNEYSVNTGAIIKDALSDEIAELKFKYDGHLSEDEYSDESSEYGEPVPYELMLIERISRGHRTLQQSFSGLVFEFLSNIEEFNTKIKEKATEGFYYTPMI